MAYTVVNLIAALVGVAFLLTGYGIVRRGREALPLFLVSLVVGVGLVFVSVFPNVFEIVATLLGLELKARAILVVSNLTLFIVVTYLFDRIGRLYDRVSRLNEEVSLLKAEIEDDDD